MLISTLIFPKMFLLIQVNKSSNETNFKTYNVRRDGKWNIEMMFACSFLRWPKYGLPLKKEFYSDFFTKISKHCNRWNNRIINTLVNKKRFIPVRNRTIDVTSRID